MLPSQFRDLSPELAAEAESLWKRLDRMAKEDPQAYEQFVEKQMKESELAKQEERKQEEAALAASLFLPQPAFCVFTKQTHPDPPAIIVYVNICSSPEVSAMLLKSDMTKFAPPDAPISSLLIPLSVGPIRSSDAPHAPAGERLVDIVVNPQTIKKGEEDLAFKLQLIELALSHIEEDHHITLHRAYKFYESSAYRGEELPRQQKEADMLKNKAEQRRKAREAAKGGPAPEIVLPTTDMKSTMAASDPPLISELKITKDKKNTNNSIKIVEKLEKTEISEEKEKAKEKEKSLPAPAPAGPKKVLIQEVDPNDLASLSQPIQTALETPHYSLMVQEGAMVLTVELPLVQTVQELTVDIGTSLLVLTSSVYSLRLPFTRAIKEQDAVAKFAKKTRTLKITAPFVK